MLRLIVAINPRLWVRHRTRAIASSNAGLLQSRKILDLRPRLALNLSIGLIVSAALMIAPAAKRFVRSDGYAASGM